MDDDYSFSPTRKASGKKGRKSGLSLASAFKFSPRRGNEDVDEVSPPSSSPFTQGDVPARRTGGWADDIGKSAKGRRGAITEIDDERFKITDNDEYPAIPDLESMEEDYIATQVAAAPNVAVNRVATYKELDTDLIKHSAYAHLDGVDLRALTKNLAPLSELNENDVPWTWDILFTEVSSELHGEWEHHATSSEA